jgi:hypothetical protein
MCVAGNELAHPADHHGAGDHGADHHGAAHHEPVVAPDQLKRPPFKRLTILAGLVTICALPLMAFVGNHQGNVEKVILVSIAGLMLLGGIVAFFLKKAGLRN